MKKFLALFMACAFACIATAGSTKKTLVFSRAQFQPETATEKGYILTVPLIYKGTASFKTEAIYNTATWELPHPTTDDVCLEKGKYSVPIYMTICQPCIDCYPCQDIEVKTTATEPEFMANAGKDAKTAALAGEKITRWNLYFVDSYKLLNGSKQVDIYKVNLGGADAVKFYSGSNKSGSLAYNTKGLWLSGKRSDYKFAYVDGSLAKEGNPAKFVWTVKGSKATAYIKSIATLQGTYDPAFQPAYEFPVGTKFYTFAKVNGTFKLSRNASLTKKAIEGTFSTTTTSHGKNWEDCSTVTDANYCEEYFAATVDTDKDKFDAYLGVTYTKSNTGVVFIEATIDGALDYILF